MLFSVLFYVILHASRKIFSSFRFVCIHSNKEYKDWASNNPSFPTSWMKILVIRVLILFPIKGLGQVWGLKSFTKNIEIRFWFVSIVMSSCTRVCKNAKLCVTVCHCIFGWLPVASSFIQFYQQKHRSLYTPISDGLQSEWWSRFLHGQHPKGLPAHTKCCNNHKQEKWTNPTWAECQ